MPCRTDVYDITEQEREHGKAARCLLFLKETVLKEPVTNSLALAGSNWEVGCGAGFKGHDWVEALFFRLTLLGESKVKSIINDHFDNPIAPMLHHWWLRHKVIDLKKLGRVPVVIGFGPSLWKDADLKENVVPVGVIRFEDADAHEESTLRVIDQPSYLIQDGRKTKRLILKDLTLGMGGLMKNFFNSRERDKRGADDWDLFYGPVGLLLGHPGEETFAYYFDECSLSSMGDQRMKEEQLSVDQLYAQYSTFTIIAADFSLPPMLLDDSITDLLERMGTT